MSVTETTNVRRAGFSTLAEGGLSWDGFPLRLFTKGNAKHWDPATIDFSSDAADWTTFDEDEEVSATTLVAQFVAGEEAVTQDIQPFMAAMAAEGRFGDEMYLSQFCLEEAKHAQGFRLWMDEVGLDRDLHGYVDENPYYREIFYEQLPDALRRLADDPSPRNQVLASVTYNHVVEGSLALTGYFAWQTICSSRNILPGMRELIAHIAEDERRHMAWGTFTCRRHVAADDGLWQVVNERMDELLPLALGMIQWDRDKYEVPPFGGEDHGFVEYAANRANRRLRAIESARGRPVEDIDIDFSPAELEDTFGEEDRAALSETEAG